MGKIMERAKQIFRQENPGPHWSIPWGARPALEDLWPEDQEQYIERAERELGIR